MCANVAVSGDKKTLGDSLKEWRHRRQSQEREFLCETYGVRAFVPKYTALEAQIGRNAHESHRKGNLRLLRRKRAIRLPRHRRSLRPSPISWDGDTAIPEELRSMASFAHLLDHVRDAERPAEPVPSTKEDSEQWRDGRCVAGVTIYHDDATGSMLPHFFSFGTGQDSTLLVDLPVGRHNVTSCFRRGAAVCVRLPGEEPLRGIVEEHHQDGTYSVRVVPPEERIAFDSEKGADFVLTALQREQEAATVGSSPQTSLPTLPFGTSHTTGHRPYEDLDHPTRTVSGRWMTADRPLYAFGLFGLHRRRPWKRVPLLCMLHSIRANPVDPLPYPWAIRLLLYFRRPQAAAALATTLWTLCPHDAAGPRLLGVARLTMGQYAEAVFPLRVAVAQDPTDAAALQWLSMAESAVLRAVDRRSLSKPNTPSVALSVARAVFLGFFRPRARAPVLAFLPDSAYDLPAARLYSSRLSGTILFDGASPKGHGGICVDTAARASDRRNAMERVNQPEPVPENTWVIRLMGALDTLSPAARDVRRTLLRLMELGARAVVTGVGGDNETESSGYALLQLRRWYHSDADSDGGAEASWDIHRRMMKRGTAFPPERPARQTRLALPPSSPAQPLGWFTEEPDSTYWIVVQMRPCGSDPTGTGSRTSLTRSRGSATVALKPRLGYRLVSPRHAKPIAWQLSEGPFEECRSSLLAQPATTTSRQQLRHWRTHVVPTIGFPRFWVQLADQSRRRSARARHKKQKAGSSKKTPRPGDAPSPRAGFSFRGEQSMKRSFSFRPSDVAGSPRAGSPRRTRSMRNSPREQTVDHLGVDTPRYGNRMREALVSFLVRPDQPEKQAESAEDKDDEGKVEFRVKFETSDDDGKERDGSDGVDHLASFLSSSSSTSSLSESASSRSPSSRGPSRQLDGSYWDLEPILQKIQSGRSTDGYKSHRWESFRKDSTGLLRIDTESSEELDARDAPSSSSAQVGTSKALSRSRRRRMSELDLQEVVGAATIVEDVSLTSSSSSGSDSDRDFPAPLPVRDELLDTTGNERKSSKAPLTKPPPKSPSFGNEPLRPSPPPARPLAGGARPGLGPRQSRVTIKSARSQRASSTFLPRAPALPPPASNRFLPTPAVTAAFPANLKWDGDPNENPPTRADCFALAGGAAPKMSLVGGNAAGSLRRSLFTGSGGEPYDGDTSEASPSTDVASPARNEEAEMDISMGDIDFALREIVVDSTPRPPLVRASAPQARGGASPSTGSTPASPSPVARSPASISPFVRRVSGQLSPQSPQRRRSSVRPNHQRPSPSPRRRSRRSVVSRGRRSWSPISSSVGFESEVADEEEEEADEDQRDFNQVALWASAAVPRVVNLAMIDSDSRREALAIYESGEYMRSVRLACKIARRFLRSERANPPWDVVVLDVDDTALSSWHHMRESQFTRVPLASPDWFQCAAAPALQPVLQLYQYIQRCGFKTVFVSERPEEAEHSTREALVRAGFHSFQHLILQPAPARGKCPLRASEFKWEARAALEKQGYRIVATVGDQDGDFRGDAVGFPVKLPNHLYFVD